MWYKIILKSGSSIRIHNKNNLCKCFSDNQNKPGITIDITNDKLGMIGSVKVEEVAGVFMEDLDLV